MKSLIITVAGKATRFNKDLSKPTLKCIYYENSPKNTLLYKILEKSKDIDQYVIVGGYLYEDLKSYIDTLDEFKPKITLVYNPHYEDYGSGYSLIKGVEVVNEKVDEIIFVEGDLYFNAQNFEQIKQTSKDVITINREFISSDKSVVLYVDANDHVHYVYDTKHKYLTVEGDFKAIYNSGQIWKFISLNKLRNVVMSLNQKQIQGTNLEEIQGYFNDLTIEQIDFIAFDTWLNCNTIFDYKKINTI